MMTWTHMLTNKLPELESILVVHSSIIKRLLICDYIVISTLFLSFFFFLH